MPAPLGPVMPIRSPASTCARDRTEPEVAQAAGGLVEGRDDPARPGRGGDVELQHPLLARLLDLVEPGDARLHLADLLRLLLRGLGGRLAPDLVVVGVLLHRVAHALRAPLALGAGARHEVGAGAGVLLVGLPRVAPGDGPLLQEGVVAAVVDRDLALGQVELHDPGDAAGQELAVVRDEDDPAAESLHERLEARQPVEVEVVGRLVEQDDVEPAEQERGQGDPGGLPAGQGRHQRVGADVEPEVGQHRCDPVVEVGRAARHPAVERDGVRVVGARLAGPEPRGGGLHRRGRLGRARAPGDVLRHRLARHPLVLLGEQADEGVAGSAVDGAGHRRTAPPSSDSSVDLPAPLAPTTPITSPGATVRSSPSNRMR